MNYKTTDTDFAAVLLYYKFKLKELDRSNQKKQVFIFEALEDNARIRELEDQYLRRDVLVEPIEFQVCKKHLNKLIYLGNNEAYIR